jgi:hypothetical protein
VALLVLLEAPSRRITLVAKPTIVELSLVELDEQPTLDGVLPAQAASAEARARARLFWWDAQR